MSSSPADGENIFQPLWEDGERIFCRGWRDGDEGHQIAVLIVELAAGPPTPGALDRLAHEYGLTDELSIAWAARQLEMVREPGRTLLVLEDPGGEPLERLPGRPMALESFLPLAIGMNRSIDSRSDLYALGSRSTRCSRSNCRSPPPIRWNGCTATLLANRRRPRSGSRASRGRSRRS
jgi:hypothetical protein